MKKIACIGECMIELFEDTASGLGTMRRTRGGDTLNSAVCLARELADRQARVHYVSVLGDDPYSAEMPDMRWHRASSASEGPSSINNFR